MKTDKELKEAAALANMGRYGAKDAQILLSFEAIFRTLQWVLEIKNSETENIDTFLKLSAEHLKESRSLKEWEAHVEKLHSGTY